MNLSTRHLLSDILRALLMVFFFTATFVAFSVLAFVMIEITLFLFVTISKYQIANDPDNAGPFMVVCLLSLSLSLIVTTILFWKQSFLPPRFHLKSDQP